MDGTMEITPRFLDAIGGNPSNCVLLVGAGLSKTGVRKGGTGIPDWDALLQLMLSHLAESGRADATECERLQAMLRETPPRYLDVAEEFAQAHAHDRDGYERFLRRHIMPADVIGSELHALILQAGFRGIVSYNFDLVFETQSDRLAPIVYPELLDQIGQFQRSGFFAKIHGCISRPATTLVLTKSSYDTLRQHPNYQHLLATVLLANKVLCVGFSLRDPDFLSILSDLKQHWSENLPPLFALIRRANGDARKEWIGRGVDILSYDKHEDLHTFFRQIVALRDVAVSPRGRPSAARRGRTAPLSNRAVGHASTAADAALVLREWDAASKLEEMDRILHSHLNRQQSPRAKESLLFHLAALCMPTQGVHLLRYLVGLSTTEASELASRIVNTAAQDDRLRELTPHRLNTPVHDWVLGHGDWDAGNTFMEKSTRHVLTWLLDEKWSAFTVDLWRTFAALVTRLRMTPTRHGLEYLYEASEHIPGAAAEIERLVFSETFVRPDDAARRWVRTWDERIVLAVRLARFQRTIREGAHTAPAELLREAIALDAAHAPNLYGPFLTMAVERLLNDFVHRTHLTLHSSSSLYDPTAAAEILAALGSIPPATEQIKVLWEICHWPERMRGLISLEEDYASLSRGLFQPLWWRYTSATRIEFLRERGRGMSRYPQRTGQDVFLEDVLALRFDVDQEFRDAFAAAVAQRPADAPDRYEPRPLQEIWRHRNLTYELSDAPPPELTRRLAVSRMDWDTSHEGELRWREARGRAAEALADSTGLARYVSAMRRDYVIENLLARYDPAQRHVTLYAPMLRCAADDLAVDAHALTTVAWIHITAHAFFHLGRDTGGAMWHDMATPPIDAPDLHLNTAHEAVAQFFTYKLLEAVADPELLAAFVALEGSALPAYSAWRSVQTSSIEDMRTVLLRLRRANSAWPPRELPETPGDTFS